MKSNIDILGYILLIFFFILQALKLFFESYDYIKAIDILTSLLVLSTLFLLLKRK